VRKAISLPTIGVLAVHALVIGLVGLRSYTFVGQDNPGITASYIAATEALAADDFPKAKAALIDLARQSKDDLKVRAEAAAAATDIMPMRTAFRELSEEIIALGVPPEYEVIICRMFRDGSRWIQKRGSIANPYWGRIMLTCGSR
jgi:hypothetical protein